MDEAAAGPTFLALLAISIGVGLVTFAVVTTTAFVKIAVVLFLVRNALGIQQTPPNLVLYAITLVLTLYISAPLLREVAAEFDTETARIGTLEDLTATAERIAAPVRERLDALASPEDRAFFVNATGRIWPQDMAQTVSPDDISVLVPAFMTSELRRAFEIGFLLYLPFLVIDLVVTTILMAMGLSMVAPSLISTPFKLLLFVTIEGWTRLISGLVLSYEV